MKQVILLLFHSYNQTSPVIMGQLWADWFKDDLKNTLMKHF